MKIVSESKAEIKYTRRLTVGGGLCAFAGFGQGLVDYALLGRFDEPAAAGRFQQFVAIFADVVKDGKNPPIANWQDFITYVRGHLTPPGTLQIQLAKALRRLMVELRKVGPGVTAGELEHLQSAFQGYVAKKLSLIENDNEDIYSRHDFIRAKFDELAAKHVATIDEMFTAELQEIEATIQDEAVKEVARAELKATAADRLQEICQPELVEWYRNEGYEKFTLGMAKDDAYAGDLELKILGRFWGVTFRVERTPRGGQLLVHTICLDFGWLNVNELSPGEVILLKDLCIVDRHSDPYRPDSLPLLEMTEASLLARVAPIEPTNEIIAVWDAWQKENAHLKSADRKPVVIPAHWGEAAKNELRVRNILVKSNGQFYFAPQHEMNKERFLQLLVPFATEGDSQRIIALWKAHYKEAPEIRCANDNAVHWVYCQPAGFPWSSLQSDAPVFSGFSGFFTGATVAAALSVTAQNLIKKDATDTLKAIEDDLCNRNVAERQFYKDHVIPKLKKIADSGRVTSDGAIRLLNPELVFKITQNGAVLTGSDESDSLDMLQIFCRMYYFNVLSAAHEQVISNVPNLRKDFNSIIMSLEGYDLCPMSELRQKNPKNAVKGMIYISEEGKYCVQDLNGEVQQGVFSGHLFLACKQLAKNLLDVEFKRRVLMETAEKGYTLNREKEFKVAKVFRQYLAISEALFRAPQAQKLATVEQLHGHDEAYACRQALIAQGEMAVLNNVGGEIQVHRARLDSFIEYFDCVMRWASLANMAAVVLQLLSEEMGDELTQDSLIYDLLQRVRDEPDTIGMQDKDILLNIRQVLKDLKKYPELKQFDETLSNNPGLKDTLMVLLDRVIETIRFNNAATNVVKPAISGLGSGFN